jgi:type IV pilus assembly protein PilW
MSTHAKTNMRPARDERGFTLVELMVTVAIALFLLGGLVTVVQTVRNASINQQALAQLQDEQRFALTVITDAIQSAGYFADPLTDTIGNFGAGVANPAPTTPTALFLAGSAFTGFHTVGAADNAAQDTLATRFMTKPGQGPILCDGTDSSLLPAATHTVAFFVQVTPGVGNQLMCSVDGNVPVALVTGVTAMAVYYGVKREVIPADYNVDTYLTWDQMVAPSDMQSVSAVRVVLSFANPLAGPGQPNQPAVITMERVVEVMARAGLHT